jgi:hypothetical protein
MRLGHDWRYPKRASSLERVMSRAGIIVSIVLLIVAAVEIYVVLTR